MEEVISIRGLNRSLLMRVRIEANRHNISVGQWVNEAIEEKLMRDIEDYIEEITPVDLSDIAKPTEIENVWEVPAGLVKRGTDYSIKGRFISAAGKNGNRVAVTSQSPSLLHDNGYRIFWIR